MADAQSIALKIEKMKSPRIKAGFERLKERQRLGFEAIEKRLEGNRKETVDIMARDLRDQLVREQHPRLKPKYLPGPSLAGLDAEAKQTAGFEYQRIVDSYLAEANKTFLTEQRRYLGTAMRALEVKENFNSRSADGCLQDNSKGKGSGR